MAEARIESQRIVNIERVDPKFKDELTKMPGTERILFCFPAVKNAALSGPLMFYSALS